MPSGKRPIRVAVIGGGCAALTAAFELSRPGHAGRYDITVYQVGWRLGGKGASGRGEAGRIEEHGLHLWMGFYENAFRLMRECYAELGRDPATCPIATWRDAFTPAPTVAVMDRASGGSWEPWVAHFPPAPGQPGDPLSTRDNPFSVSAYLQRTVSLLLELLRSASERQAGEPGAVPPPGPWELPRSPEAVVQAVERVLRYGQLATVAALFEATDMLRAAMATLQPSAAGAGGPVLRLIDALATSARRQLELLVGGDTELRRIWQVVDLILAILRGATLSGLAFDPRGFDALNDQDWREWLRQNGASAQSLDSGFVRGIYDLVFAYEDGDVARPSLAAGVALRGAMRMFFTYRGSLFWWMSAGMGDIVFSPLYEVLRRRGVRFEFFHRLRDVKLAPATRGEPSSVEALEFDVQARVRGGGEYQPLVRVNRVPCWPAAPLYEQLVEGAALEAAGWDPEAHWEQRKAGSRTLRVRDDFDLVVLGVGLGAIPYVCRELVAREPRWRDMVTHVKTVATQAAQLWMTEDMAALGWKGRPVNLSGYVEPFDTWADMRHLLPQEGWTRPVWSLAYLCSVLPDAGAADAVEHQAFHEAQHAHVRDNLVRFLQRDAGTLWPGAMRNGQFRWELLASEARGAGAEHAPSGEARVDTQYWTANVNPSDRYVLSVPGSCKHRLSPLDMSVDNLTVAGDWTASGLDSGCVESAVMSGLLAAHALSQSPPLEDIIGYDHP
jgi:uncharacterized protein with NAD-binding domain and iron-sulfur cluster